ncbi:hypothetical protein H696_00275 [Fonticula alba]|uniref:EF-hand domain-containing protein n=1 Tax=Fonticula alba TaxID=691883 RepID=A0A058ZFG7_FONAL|nr:hypothetical protein H696_00275 [Fonticula alba]KCV72696.1 hypothetical protein H696_00275 [Fonticula alba]|eukprot:XP_009492397.1 hypothetical protein H696_00275 [Fonticula alba]
MSYQRHPPPGHGGYPAMSPQEAQLLNFFRAVDTDRSGTINAEELQRCLTNGGWANRPFAMSTINLLINLFDVDNNGTIDFQKFKGIWSYIGQWVNVFRQFDRDQSGSIDIHELRTALRQFGYALSDQMVSILLRKYSVPDQTGIAFDHFIELCATLQSLTNAFRRYDINQNGWATMQYEQFLGAVFSIR